MSAMFMCLLRSKGFFVFHAGLSTLLYVAFSRLAFWLSRLGQICYDLGKLAWLGIVLGYEGPCCEDNGFLEFPNIKGRQFGSPDGNRTYSKTSTGSCQCCASSALQCLAASVCLGPSDIFCLLVTDKEHSSEFNAGFLFALIVSGIIASCTVHLPDCPSIGSAKLGVCSVKARILP